MRYFIIAGEASGDLHASNLMKSLKEQDAKAEFCFLGGDLMANQGGKMIRHYRDMAYMGFVAVIRNSGKVLKNIADCKEAIIAFKPDVLILVDYPGFNLRMAKFAKVNLQIPVYYYISPKLWAWKEYRIKEIKKYVDKMFTIFPFETEFYANHNYKVDYVGNPTVDTILQRPNQNQTFKEFCEKNQLPEKPVIAILAGSRKQEISACLPRMIEAASGFNDFQIVIAGAPGIENDFYKSLIDNEKFNVIFGQTYELVQHSKAAIVNSGTATLETAIIGTPEVVVYHVMLGRFLAPFRKLLFKVPFFSLVNLIAGKEVVKELVAHYFTVENVSAELNLILNDVDYRKKMLSEYERIKTVLGDVGAAKNAAEKIISYLK